MTQENVMANRTINVRQRDPGELGPAPPNGRVEITAVRVDGNEVVVKSGSGSARERLRREAEVLQRLDTPYVVEFHALLEGPDHTELQTLRHGPLTLADAPLMTPNERLDLMRASCVALGELHSLGWTHGNISGEHLLVELHSPGDRGVRICSLSRAEPLAIAGPGVGSHPGVQVLNDSDLVSDRFELRSVVYNVLESNSDLGSRMERLWWRLTAWRLRRRLRGHREVPTPGELLRLLGGEVANLGREPASEPNCEPMGEDLPTVTRRARHKSRMRATRPVVLAAGFIAATLVSLTLAFTPLPSARTSDDSAPSGADPTAEPVNLSPVQPLIPPRVCLSQGSTPKAENSTFCTDDVGVEGQVVRVGGVHFDIGVSGDEIRVGDWRCDGRATAAVLRPSTGVLYEFSDWATDSELTAKRVAEVIGAESLEAPQVCGMVPVTTAGGTTHQLPLPPPG